MEELGRKFGYARVSTNQQLLDTQKKRLKDEGVKETRIFCDKATGSNLDRPGINDLLNKVEEGDTILITKLDRLGRDTLDMMCLINQFDQKGVFIRFLDDGISTEGTMGRTLMIILSALAESERRRILERTNEGREEVKSKNIKFGRKRSINRNKLLKLKEEGIKGTALAKEMKISRAAVYKILKEEKFEKDKYRKTKKSTLSSLKLLTFSLT